MIGHRVDPLANIGAASGVAPLARHPEAEVVLEEVDVPVHVRHHELLVDDAVAFEQIGDRRVVVDDQLVNLREPVLVALTQALVLHPPAPMRIASWEAAVCSDLIHLVVAQDLEDRRKEIQANVSCEVFDATLLVTQVVWKSRFQCELGHALLAFPQELPNRLDDRVAVVDFARDQLLVAGEVLFEVFDELPRAIGAIDLAVAKDVGSREQEFLQNIDTEQSVIDAPVVAIREMEGVDVPFARKGSRVRRCLLQADTPTRSSFPRIRVCGRRCRGRPHAPRHRE